MSYLRVTHKEIDKFFDTALKKLMNMLHASIFSFIILNLVQKVFWTFMLLQQPLLTCVWKN